MYAKTEERRHDEETFLCVRLRVCVCVKVNAFNCPLGHSDSQTLHRGGCLCSSNNNKNALGQNEKPMYGHIDFIDIYLI